MIVHVVSWVYWNGDEQGGGGFDWTPDRQVAIAGFDEERKRWRGGVARVRLVLDVPIPEGLNNRQITDYLDDNIDRLEAMQSQGGLPAAKVALVLT